MVLLVICNIVYLFCGGILIHQGTQKKEMLITILGFAIELIVLLAFIALLFIGGVFKFS